MSIRFTIQQQRWGMFLRMLEHKAARAGIKYVGVTPVTHHSNVQTVGTVNPKRNCL